MNSRQKKNDPTAVTTALHQSLAKLLQIELQNVTSDPTPPASEISSELERLREAHSHQATYDQMFNNFLLARAEADGHPASEPAVLGRLYSQWNREQEDRLEDLQNQLDRTIGAAAEQNVRTTLADALETVLSHASVHGQTLTEQLELMNLSAADPKRPIKLIRPDGTKTTIKYWYQVLQLPVLALAEQGLVTTDMCPIQLPGAKHPVLEATENVSRRSQNPNRHRPLPGGTTLWTNHNTQHICRIAAETLRALGQRPEGYAVQYHPRRGHDGACPTMPACQEIRAT